MLLSLSLFPLHTHIFTSSSCIHTNQAHRPICTKLLHTYTYTHTYIHTYTIYIDYMYVSHDSCGKVPAAVLNFLACACSSAILGLRGGRCNCIPMSLSSVTVRLPCVYYMDRDVCVCICVRVCVVYELLSRYIIRL